MIVTPSRAARSLALAAALAFGPSVLWSQTAVRPVGPDGWRVDLHYLVTTLKAVHPRPFHRVLEPVFDRAVRTLEDRLPRLTDGQAAVGLMRLVALVNDGHTVLEPGGSVLPGDRWFPVRIDRFADGLFVVATGPDQRSLLGREVVRIGGRPAPAVWDSLMAIAPGDNVFSRLARVPLWLMLPSLGSALGISTPQSMELTVRREGREETVRVASIAATRSIPMLLEDAVAGDSSVAVLDGRRSAADWSAQWPSDWYWYRLDRPSGILYARFNVVSDGAQPVHLGDAVGRLSLGELGQRLVGLIDSGQASTLIIDLRRNPGGNNSLIVPFVQALAARPAINRPGHLFVITGRHTYSAAMNFTSLLEERTGAIFVGEPPGGSPSHYGDATSFHLPRSGLELRVSTLHWDLGVSPSDVREVHEPDLPVTPRFADLEAGKDPALDLIRAWRPGASLAEQLMDRYRRDGLDSAVALAKRLPAEPAPWSSRVGQFEKFVHAVIRSGAKGPEIYRAAELPTELVPESAVAWFELGRTYQYGGRAREAAQAFRRAHEVRPAQDLIRRMYEAATRQSDSGTVRAH